MSCEAALHMSYTVSAATEQPTSASISTPVLFDTTTRHSTSASTHPPAVPTAATTPVVAASEAGEGAAPGGGVRGSRGGLVVMVIWQSSRAMGWQNGMRSLVRFAAMTPATTAVLNTAPFAITSSIAAPPLALSASLVRILLPLPPPGALSGAGASRAGRLGVRWRATCGGRRTTHWATAVRRVGALADTSTMRGSMRSIST
mmetsp:Transcript_14596/g.24899  ORF Transcript_14596/g.24899 Transcript_14596/m.24899 type:complete len:202 (+) Transcript_14596:404-1009(+)